MPSICDFAGAFKAMSDDTRLKIVSMLAGGELCACDILEAFEITQPTLSYHMRILTESGLVRARKDGAWTRYTLNEGLIRTLNRFLADVLDEKTGQEPASRAACDASTAARCREA